MNIQGLKNIWSQSIIIKVYIILSFFLGIFFLFSLLSKIVSFDNWIEFNINLIDNNFGIVNSIIILAIEAYFSYSFITLRISNTLLFSSFVFVLFLTLFVWLNRDLFQTCMCFGDIIEFKPDLKFVIKNTLLIFLIIVVYVIKYKTNPKD